MAMGGVDIGLRLALLPPIIEVVLVDHNIFIVMVITEIYIGLIPSNFLHKTIVD